MEGFLRYEIGGVYLDGTWTGLFSEFSYINA